MSSTVTICNVLGTDARGWAVSKSAKYHEVTASPPSPTGNVGDHWRLGMLPLVCLPLYFFLFGKTRGAKLAHSLPLPPPPPSRCTGRCSFFFRDALKQL